MMAQTELPLRVEPTCYQVTKYPEGGVNASHFTIFVERRGPDSWCVKDLFWCYDKDGNRQHEPLPSTRTDDFKERFRFPLDEALELAKRLAPQMTLGAGPQRDGQTAEEVWAWEREQS